jgi:HEAT repeat protein
MPSALDLRRASRGSRAHARAGVGGLTLMMTVGTLGTPARLQARSEATASSAAAHRAPDPSHAAGGADATDDAAIARDLELVPAVGAATDGGGRAAPARPRARAAWLLRRGPTVLARVEVDWPPAGGARRTEGATPVLEALPVERHDVHGHRVLVARVRRAGAGGDPADGRVWTWLGEEQGQTAREMWSGLTGPRDADAETAEQVHIGPPGPAEPSGGGDAELDGGVVLYQTAAEVSRCDDAPPWLFARRWDFAARRFRPIDGPVPPPAPVVVTAHRHDPAMPGGAPLGGFRFVASSTRLGDGGDARGLGAPTGLDDGNPATAWVEGRGGDGRGAFLTARAFGGRYTLRGLRIVPGDARWASTFRTHNRLRALSVLYGRGAGQRFDVRFAEDPAAGLARGDDARTPYWVPFPEPVDSGCLTVVVREVYPAEGAPAARTEDPAMAAARGAGGGSAGAGTGATAISELQVFTDLDFSNGLERLIADTARGPGCSARVPLLANLGEAAVLPLAQAILATSAIGRECLVTALASIPATTRSTVAVDALVAALRGASPTEEAAIAGVLERATRNPASSVAELLRDARASAEDRARAARILGRLAGPDATRALLEAVGDGPPEVRLATVQALTEAFTHGMVRASGATSNPAPPGPPGTLRLDAEVDTLAAAIDESRGAPAGARPHREADLLRVLPGLLAHAPAARARAVRILEAALGPGRPYEAQARAIGALGAVAALETTTEPGAGGATSGSTVSTDISPGLAPGIAATLATLRATSPDPVLRTFATRALAELRLRVPATRVALRAALDDADPRVREAAAQGLGARSDAASEAALIAAAKREPWPFVRRAQLEALSRSCGPDARALLVRAIERDDADVGRVALLGLDRCEDPRLPRFLLTILRARTADPSLRELAAEVLGDRDHEHDRGRGPDVVAAASAHALAELLPALTNEAEGELAVEAVVVSALGALGALGGVEAARAAAALARDPAHPYRHTAIEALGRICDPGVGAATLAALRADKDPELALAAAASEKACRDRVRATAGPEPAGPGPVGAARR